MLGVTGAVDLTNWTNVPLTMDTDHSKQAS